MVGILTALLLIMLINRNDLRFSDSARQETRAIDNIQIALNPSQKTTALFPATFPIPLNL